MDGSSDGWMDGMGWDGIGWDGIGWDGMGGMDGWIELPETMRRDASSNALDQRAQQGIVA